MIHTCSQSPAIKSSTSSQHELHINCVFFVLSSLQVSIVSLTSLDRLPFPVDPQPAVSFQNKMTFLFLLLFVVIFGKASADLVVPGWNENTFKYNGSECVHGNKDDEQHNSRTTFFALPSGRAPEAGWPVYMYFPPWSVPSDDAAHVSCDHQTIPSPLSSSCKVRSILLY